MRILLTGTRGQVGSALKPLLESHGTIIAPPTAEFDLSKPEVLTGELERLKPDLIINPAAYTAVDRAEDERELAFLVNAKGPETLAKWAATNRVPLVHFSTDYVFDGSKAGAYSEDDPVAPLNVYGRTKLEGERAIAQAGAAHLVLRTSWVYGPRGANFMLTMLRLARTREALRVVDDQRGAPTSSLQLARLVSGLLGGSGPVRREGVDALAAAAGTYHATAAGETTWCGFAAAIFEEAVRAGRLAAAPRLVPIASSEYPTPARRPANSVLSNARIESAFGLRIGHWREGLREALSALPAG